MNRRAIFLVVVAVACVAAAVSMYVVRTDANALRLHAGKLGASVSFTGMRPSTRGVIFRDAIFRRSGSFDLYFVAPELRTVRRGSTWSILAEDNILHAFGPSFLLPSAAVHRAEFAFGKGEVFFDGEVAAPFFMIDTPRVHDRPLTWAGLQFTASGRVDEATSVITLDRGSVRKDDAAIDVSGSWRMGFSARPATLEFRSHGLSGDQLRRLVPKVLTTRLGDVGFGGQLGFNLRLAAGEWPTDRIRVALELDNRLTVTGLIEGCSLMPRASSFVWDEYDSAGGSVSHESGPASDGWCTLGSLPATVSNAVVARVDPLFPVHRGVAPSYIANLLESAINRTEPEGLTATITERFAATLWPLPGNGLRHRVEMAILAVHLEQSLDKSSILTLYVNTADFGHGVRGVREAARRLLAKSPGELTAGDGVVLAMILALPSEPVVDNAGHVLPSAAPAVRALLDNLHARGIVTDEQYHAAVEELDAAATPTG
jgi:hypothetical protein